MLALATKLDFQTLRAHLPTKTMQTRMWVDLYLDFRIDGTISLI